MEKIDIANEITHYLENDQLKDVEKDLINVLNKLLHLFLSVINPKKQNKKDQNPEEHFINNKNEIIKFLEDRGYCPIEFKILKVDAFNNYVNYFHMLMNNLCYYLNKYKYEQNETNIYCYLFHLIYFILSIIIKSKDKILFNDDILKFYFHHIVHFFKKEEKTPEGHYFFYHGAFKLLKKRYKIQTNYVIGFDDTVLKFQDISNAIINNLQDLEIDKLSSFDAKTEEELNFFGNISQFKITYLEIIQSIKNIYACLPPNDSGKFIEHISASIKEIKDILSKVNITYDKLDEYYSLINEFKTLITNNRMTKNDLILMELNYRKIPEKDDIFNDYTIKRYINLAKFFDECDKDSNEDFTDIFKQIINSEEFKKLYHQAMDSIHIKKFVNDFQLNNLYKNFMDNYANNINEYILYVPLTRGIKAYVSNYFRIALNINSIEILGEFNDNSKNEILTSYLLIQLLHESFHFLFRLNKEGKNSGEGLSPKKEKIMETYQEIGVDLILYIFGTEYITYISKKNSSLICDIKAWQNSGTNFKVFNKVYLSNYRLTNENDKEIEMNSGLRCNITAGYEYCDTQNFKICTDDVIKYCF